MKIHWACGTTYLKDYINIDIEGFVLYKNNPKNAFYTCKEGYRGIDELDLSNGNPNETTIDKYFIDPWEPDTEKRGKNKRPFIMDMQANILKKWPFENDSVNEIILISAWEHFWPQHIKNHIVPEICRVLKQGGRLIVDFPDIVKTVEDYKGFNEEEMMNLIYCNHRHEFAIHHYGYTEETFKKLWPENYSIKRNDIVKHDYPMIGMEVFKK